MSKEEQMEILEKLNPCFHPTLVPYLLVAGKRTWEKDQAYIDYSSNIINAHYLKVLKYYCPICNSIIEPPSDAKDE